MLQAAMGLVAGGLVIGAACRAIFVMARDEYIHEQDKLETAHQQMLKDRTEDPEDPEDPEAATPSDDEGATPYGGHDDDYDGGGSHHDDDQSQQRQSQRQSQAQPQSPLPSIPSTHFPSPPPRVAHTVIIAEPVFSESETSPPATPPVPPETPPYREYVVPT